MPPPFAQPMLPLELTSFVGREDDVARLVEAFGAERLVTIAGGGGIGKTRTALRVAHVTAHAWRDGIVFVDLAPLRPGDSVEATIQQALAAAQRTANSRGELIERISGQHLAIVLDNCEHVLTQAGAAVNAMLRVCPNVHILATSRQALGVPGEFIWRLPPLPLPSVDDHLDYEQLAKNPAVALFLDRAERVRPAMLTGREDADAIIQVCRAVDGVPLAIELAAARLRLLSVVQLADRIRDQLPVLVSRSQVGPERQRTMRAAIAWSHDRLTETEKFLFRRLAVFSGGWTLEAAEGICADNGILTDEVLDILDALVDCSLVIAAADGGESRFRLLFPVLEFARAELLASSELEELGVRHCRWFARFVGLAKPHLVGPGEVFWGERLERDHDNLIAALAWSASHRTELEQGLEIVELHWFWIRLGRQWEALQWSRRLLTAEGSAGSKARLGALLTASWFASAIESLEEGERYASEALLLARDSGDALSLIHALKVDAHNRCASGAFEETRASAFEALLLAEELPLARLPVVEIMVDLAIAEEELGNFDASADVLQRALGLAVAGGSRRQQALVLNCLGSYFQLRGDFEAAVQSYRDSLALATEVGFVRLVSWGNVDLGLVQLLSGELAEARDSLRTAIEQGLHRNERDLVATSLLGLAGVEAISGDPAQAARWLGAIEPGMGGLVFHALDRQVVEFARSRAEQKLGPRFKAETEAGRRFGLMDSAREAVTALGPVRPRRVASTPSVLSARETEVVRLLVDGASNREIAERLVLSIRTVEAHLANVYAKFGARGRVEAVRIALDARLVTPGGTG